MELQTSKIEISVGASLFIISVRIVGEGGTLVVCIPSFQVCDNSVVSALPFLKGTRRGA